MIKRITSALVMGGLLMLVSGGAAEARGGNHGCDQAAGSFFSSHFWDAGDNVIFGFKTDSLAAQNNESGTDQLSALKCGNEVGGWNLVRAQLGPGNDSVRLDAKGITFEGGYERVPDEH